MPVTDRGGIDTGKREKRMYREAIRNRYHWAKKADKDTIQAGSVQSAIISAGSLTSG